MDSKDLKTAIEAGIKNHADILLEANINLNSNILIDSALISRTMAAINIVTIKYRLSGEKFIATNETIAKRLISPLCILETPINGYMGIALGADVYVVDDLDENYVCVGCKDDINKSYTFRIG